MVNYRLILKLLTETGQWTPLIQRVITQETTEPDPTKILAECLFKIGM